MHKHEVFMKILIFECVSFNLLIKPVLGCKEFFPPIVLINVIKSLFFEYARYKLKMMYFLLGPGCHHIFKDYWCTKSINYQFWYSFSVL